MPISKKMINLLQASEAACHTATWHIVLSGSLPLVVGRVVGQAGMVWLCWVKVHAAGTDILVTGLLEQYRKIQNYIMNHVTWEPEGYDTTHTLAYAPLSCSSLFC